MANEVDRELRDRLPSPLASLYVEATNLATDLQWEALHKRLLRLVETAVALAAIAQIAVYRASGAANAKIEASLGDHLARPSFGHWVGWLREISASNTTLTSHPFPAVQPGHAVLNEKRRDLPAIQALLVELGKVSPDKQHVQLQNFVQALLEHRNDETHHRLPSTDPFFARIGPKLFAAVTEFLRQISLTGEAELTFVEKIVQDATGESVHGWQFIGATPVRIRVALADFSSVRPLAGRLYLRHDRTLLDLHPLLTCNLNRDPPQVQIASTATAFDPNDRHSPSPGQSLPARSSLASSLANPPNPFSRPSTELLGREEEIRRIREKLQTGHCSIVGPPGSGRSFVLQKIRADVPSWLQCPPQAVQSLSLRGINSLRELQEEIIRPLGGQKAGEWRLMLLAAPLRLLILDHMSGMDPGRQGLAMRRWLRGLYDDYKTKLLMVTNDRLEIIFRKDDPMQDSPLAGLDPTPVQFAPLPPAICRQIVEKRLAGGPLTVEQFADLCGQPRQPRELLNLCAQRFEQLQKGGKGT